MNRHLVLACLFFASGFGLYAQVVDTTVCDVVKNPASFNGKMVRIKGTVFAGFDEFAIKDATQDPNCGFEVNAIWLSYPAGTKGKAGPAAMLVVQPAKNFAGAYSAPERTPVTLLRDKNFKQFDSQLAQPHQTGDDMCLGCTRYVMTATLVGRLDGVADASLKYTGGKITGFGGFGNMNAYPARLVLQSVSDLTPKEVDYSKTDEITKNLTGSFPQGSNAPQFINPLEEAQKEAAALKSNAAGAQLEKAAEAFPKGKEQNGVSIEYGAANEASPNNETLGTKDSPDGVLFTCILNQDRLPGDAATRAIVHFGDHIADLRNPAAGGASAPPIALENDAWNVTAISAIVSGQKFLTLPGGYMLWNSTWTAAERNSNIAAAIKDFLANEAMLSR